MHGTGLYFVGFGLKSAAALSAAEAGASGAVQRATVIPG
jgi:hypothetical protein